MNIWISGQDGLFAEAIHTYLRYDSTYTSIKVKMDDIFSGAKKFDLSNPYLDLLILECDYDFWKSNRGDIHKMIEEITNTKILLIIPDIQPDFVNEILELGVRGIYYKNNGLIKVKDAIEALYNSDAYITPDVATLLLDQIFIKKKPEYLSTREHQILIELANGNSYKLIADSLNITIHTVRHHVQSLYRKLKVNSKAEAIKKYYQGFSDS